MLGSSDIPIIPLLQGGGGPPNPYRTLVHGMAWHADQGSGQYMGSSFNGTRTHDQAPQGRKHTYKVGYK